MYPKLAQRDDDTPSYMAEIGVDTCKKALYCAYFKTRKFS